MIRALFLLLLCTIGLYAQADQVRVTNAREFLEAIAPGRTIILAPGEYLLSERPSNFASQYVRFEDAYDGFEAIVHDVANLEIKGEGTHDSHLITKPRYGHVLRFENCATLKINNIKAGHGPEKGYCTGGVLNFKDCADVSILNSFLYGSGTEGITAERVAKLRCDNSVIMGCTYSIMSLREVADASFSGGKFFDNQEFEQLNIQQCARVAFEDCRFRNNRKGDWDNINFMRVDESGDVSFKNCEFLDNKADAFANEGAVLKLKGCTFKGNSWPDQR